MAKPNDPLKAVKDFLKEVEEDEYLVPDLGQEQREETLFKEQILDPAFGERERDANDGCVAPWDMNLRWPMSEESDEEYKLKAQAFGSMGLKRLEDGLDAVFFTSQKECLDWWDQQPFDLKRRCLERVLVLYGKQLIKTAAKDKYKEIISGTAWQNHHALKEACEHLRQFVDGAEKEMEEAQLVVMRYELEKTQKELENKKALLKKKNKEIRMLRERDKNITRQLLGED